MDKRVRKKTYLIKPPPNTPESQLEKHPSWRRYTRKYLRKKAIVKDVWIASGTMIIFMPLYWQITMLLITTFLSFCILDETA